MMSSWKSEGRNVVWLMTFMMWMLFILRGAEAATVTSILATSSNLVSQNSVAATTLKQTPSLTVGVLSTATTTATTTAKSTDTATARPTAKSTDTATAKTTATATAANAATATATATATDAATVSVQSSPALAKSFSTFPVSPTVTPSPQNKTIVTQSIQTSSKTSTAAVIVQPSPTSVISLSNSSVSPTGKPASQSGGEAIYIKMTFKMPWGRLCFLLPLFKQALSDDLIEFIPMQHGDIKYLTYEKVKPARIKLMSVNEKCKNKTFYNDEAVLKFYISNNTEGLPFNDTGFIDADKDMTIKAFKILYRYWVNKLMILLDKIFENKVEKVELIGDDEEDYVDEYTEIQRIGIGIGVGLAVVVLIILIYFCVRGYRDVKSVGRTPEDKRMIFTNTAAINEEASKDAEDTRNADEPRYELPDEVVVHADEPRYVLQDEVVVHTQPLAQAPDEMPLLSAVKDYEDGQKDVGSAPLAKPEPDTVSDGEPIKPPDEFKGEPIRSPDEPEGEPIKSPNEHEYESIKSPDEPEAVPAPEEAPPVSEPPATEPDETFTSSVTIIITPETSPTTIEFPAAYVPPEPAKESDDVKPDLGQSDNVDVDPTQGAINLAFDDEYVRLAEVKDKEDEEETKF